MDENVQYKSIFNSIENLIIKPIKMANKAKNKANIDTNLLSEFSLGGVRLKNRLCFLGLNDNGFCDKDGIPTDDYFEFYKKIAESGVGLIATGGAFAGTDLFRNVKKCNYCKIHYTIEENDIYSAFTRLIHTFGTKVFFKIKSVFGRADDKNGVFYNFSRTASKIRCYNNSLLPTVKLSDGKCDKIIQEISKMATFATNNDFDGIVLDASLFGLMGEFSSPELNLRKFGYYSETKDFLEKILTKFKVAGIRKNIFLEFSFASFCQDVYGKDFDTIKTIKNFGKATVEQSVLEFLKMLVKLGVDGFIFKLGTFETEFLSVFNEFECENMLESFYKKIQNFFESEKLLTKYGEKVTLICHDNFDTLSNIALKNEENFMFDITKQILANENYLTEIKSDSITKKCIKCSICDNSCRKENKVVCSINPSITYFEKGEESAHKNIAIIGAGVSGINCALELAKSEHKIDLFESSKQINPHGRAMEIFGYNEPLKNYNDYLEYKIKKLSSDGKINLYLNKSFSVDKTNIDSYDTIIVATGFKEKFSGVSGAILSNVKNIYEALSDSETFENKKNIVIDAKSELSFELAMYLLLQGKFVSLILSDLKIVHMISNDKLSYFLYTLKSLGCKVYVQAKVKRIEADFVEVYINNKLSNQNFVTTLLNSKSKNYFRYEQKAKSIDCDQFIYEPETYPNVKVFYELVQKNYGGKLYMIGNALQNSNLENDIKTAFFVAKNV